MNDKNKIDHSNVFESYIAIDIFIMDIIEKVANDWKKANRKLPAFNRENLEDFFQEDFLNWLEFGLEEWCNEEWSEEE